MTTLFARDLKLGESEWHKLFVSNLPSEASDSTLDSAQDTTLGADALSRLECEVQIELALPHLDLIYQRIDSTTWLDSG